MGALPNLTLLPSEFSTTCQSIPSARVDPRSFDKTNIVKYVKNHSTLDFLHVQMYLVLSLAESTSPMGHSTSLKGQDESKSPAEGAVSFQ